MECKTSNTRVLICAHTWTSLNAILLSCINDFRAACGRLTGGDEAHMDTMYNLRTCSRHCLTASLTYSESAKIFKSIRYMKLEHRDHRRYVKREHYENNNANMLASGYPVQHHWHQDQDFKQYMRGMIRTDRGHNSLQEITLPYGGYSVWN